MAETAAHSPELMTVKEVAAYLRLKERKIYDLANQSRIPSVRVSGKWLFPKKEIDQWLANNRHGETGAAAAAAPRPAIAAGSHDPLLEWSLRESGCGIALLPNGSTDGLAQLAGGDALLCGLHVYDAGSDAFNTPAVARLMPEQDVVVLTWAWRQQGLVLAPGNPFGVQRLQDLQQSDLRLAQRQEGAGARLLFRYLLKEAGIDETALRWDPHPYRSETDLAAAVFEGKADAGLAVAAVAHQFRLDFLPLMRERFDLVIHRRDYFEPAFQTLLRFTRTDAFRERVEELTGYDVTELGAVRYNGP